MSQRLTVDEPRYGPITVRGARFVMLLNPPLSILGTVATDPLGALETLIREHPVDRADGTPAVVGDFDTDLARDIVEAWGDEIKALPKS